MIRLCPRLAELSGDSTTPASPIGEGGRCAYCCLQRNPDSEEPEAPLVESGIPHGSLLVAPVVDRPISPMPTRRGERPVPVGSRRLAGSPRCRPVTPRGPAEVTTLRISVPRAAGTARSTGTAGSTGSAWMIGPTRSAHPARMTGSARPAGPTLGSARSARPARATWAARAAGSARITGCVRRMDASRSGPTDGCRPAQAVALRERRWPHRHPHPMRRRSERRRR